MAHPEVAFVKYFYFYVVAIFISFALAFFFSSNFFNQIKNKLLLVLAASALAAVLTSFLVNPIAYLLAGADIWVIPGRVLSTALLPYALLYLIWSLLFLHFFIGPVWQDKFFKHEKIFKVEKEGEKRILPSSKVCALCAKGDYVEVIGERDTYLVKSSLKSLSKDLNQTDFKRIHRSVFVNRKKIKSVKSKGSGIYEVTIFTGRVFRSSRSNKKAIENILPKG